MINSTNRLDCYHFEKRERFLRPPLIADNFTNFPLLLFLLLRLRSTNDAGLKIVFPTNYYSCSTATSLMSASARFHKRGALMIFFYDARLTTPWREMHYRSVC